MGASTKNETDFGVAMKMMTKLNLEDGRKVKDVALIFYGVGTVVVIKMMIRQPRAI